MSLSQLKQRMVARRTYIFGAGLAVGTVDVLHKAAIDVDSYSLAQGLYSVFGVYINSLFIACFLVLIISAFEQHAGQGKRHALLLALALGVTSILASAVVILRSHLLVAAGYNDNISDFLGLYMHILWTTLVVAALSAVYFMVWEREQQMAAQIWEARLERIDSEHRLLESQLNVMKSRVEPAFLVNMIGKIEAQARRDPAGAELSLEDLIAYLRAALPQLHGAASTLGDELALTAAYARLHADGFRAGLGWEAAASPAMLGLHFPPMALLPLVDDALRRAHAQGLERLELQLALSEGVGRFSLCVSDNGAAQPGAGDASASLHALEKSYRAFFEGDATITRTRRPDGGTAVMLDAPCWPAGAPLRCAEAAK